MDETAFDPLKLENQLCFPLYACAREVVKRYKPFLDDLGLTYTQYVTMMVMWEHRQITSREIGDKLRLDSGTLTPVLKKLEERGLVERCRSREDERNLVVTLTEEGMALRGRAVEIPKQLGECIPLSPSDAIALHDILHRLLASL